MTLVDGNASRGWSLSELSAYSVGGISGSRGSDRAGCLGKSWALIGSFDHYLA